MDGEWVTVSEYAQIMGITPQRVHQKIRQGQLQCTDMAGLAATNPTAYRKIGRGFSGTCSLLVFLSDNDNGSNRRRR